MADDAMTENSSDGSRRRLGRRIGLGLLGVLAVLVLVFYVGGGWLFSSRLHKAALSGPQRRAELANPAYELTVSEVGRDSVVLSPSNPEDVPNEYDTGQLWALRWPEGGWGQVGAILSTTPTTIRRDFTHIQDPPVAPGSAAELSSWAFLDDPLTGLGLPYQDVSYQGELGAYPAWLVDGSRSTWVIIVHGNSMSRLDGMRMLSIVAGLGYPSLVISYRNAPGAPEDPSGMLAYGATEWRDLESAVQHALDQGAEDVVLAGYSMGGSATMGFLYRSELAHQTRAVILDSPMLDFSRTVDDNAAREPLPLLGTVPQSLATVAKLFASLRFGIEWDELNYLDRSSELTKPMLVIHGEADLSVPITLSRELAAARPDIVTFLTVPGAEHVQSWNIDPVAYTGAVTDFLAAHSG